MKIILFDAHAILRWTQKERGYQKVKNLLMACRDQSATGYMNQINLGEVYYKTIRAVGIDRAKEFLENVFRLPVQIILPDSELIWRLPKSRRRTRFPMPIVLRLQQPSD
jgi:predicted nucleic acid-binding protein